MQETLDKTAKNLCFLMETTSTENSLKLISKWINEGCDSETIGHILEELVFIRKERIERYLNGKTIEELLFYYIVCFYSKRTEYTVEQLVFSLPIEKFNELIGFSDEWFIKMFIEVRESILNRDNVFYLLYLREIIDISIKTSFYTNIEDRAISINQTLNILTDSI